MSISTVGELIACLEALDPDAPVAIASQPSWPFEFAIHTLAVADDGTVYIAQESQEKGYLPQAACQALNW
jgi:hypothetical protein